MIARTSTGWDSGNYDETGEGIGAVFVTDTEPFPDFGRPDLFDLWDVYSYIVSDHRGLYSVVVGYAIPLVSWIWRRSPRPEDERKPAEPCGNVWRPP